MPNLRLALATVIFFTAFTAPVSAQVSLTPWALATPAVINAGSVVTNTGNGFGLAFGNCVTLRSICHVEEHPFLLSSALREVQATTTMTIGPCPTWVEFTCELNGVQELQDVPGSSFVSTHVNLDGVPFLACGPVPLNIVAVGVRVVADTGTMTLCLQPGAYVVEAHLITSAQINDGLGADDAISDFFNAGPPTRQNRVCINDLGCWHEDFIPPGLWCTAHFKSATPGLQTPGGLWLHHPTGAYPAYPVAGLSNELMGIGAPATANVGANCIAFSDPWAGAVYVGEITSSAAGPGLTTLDLHEVFGTGTQGAVQDMVVAQLGPAVSTQAQIAGVAMIPGAGRDAVLALAGHAFQGSSLVRYFAGSQPGISGVAVPIPVSFPVSGAPNAVAVEPTGQVIIAGLLLSLTSSTIVAVPILGGYGVALAQIPAGVSGLAVDPKTGLIYASCLGGPPNLFQIDPVTGSVSTIYAPIGTTNGIALEEASGALAVVGGAAGFPPVAVHRVLPVGSAALLTQPPSAGWGSTAGVVVSPNPRRYGGTSTASWFAVDWDLPWSGASTTLSGLATAGNVGFGLSISSTPNGVPLSGFIGVAAGRADPGIPAPGGGLLFLDPGSIVAVLPVSGYGQFAVPIPLPPGIIGLEAWFQAAVGDGFGGWVLSPGLHARTQ